MLIVLLTTQKYEIEPLKNKRLKRIPKSLDNCLSIDEHIVELLNKFRIETYNTLFDVTLTEINSRFNVISCGVLNDLSLLTEKRIMEVRESNVLPDDSFLVFCQVYNNHQHQISYFDIDIIIISIEEYI